MSGKTKEFRVVIKRAGVAYSNIGTIAMDLSSLDFEPEIYSKAFMYIESFVYYQAQTDPLVANTIDDSMIIEISSNIPQVNALSSTLVSGKFLNSSNNILLTVPVISNLRHLSDGNAVYIANASYYASDRQCHIHIPLTSLVQNWKIFVMSSFENNIPADSTYTLTLKIVVAE